MVTTQRAGERGFTIIEVMIAVLVLVVGLVGTLQAFISADDGNMATQQAQALSTAAEQQLEQLRAMTYNSLALSSLPTGTGDGNGTGDTSGDPSDPDYWVSGSYLKIANNFAQEAGGLLSTVAATGEALISGGSVSPGPVTVTSDGYTVTIYRYISWVVDSCVLGSVNLCPGAEDAKRITVAAVLSGSNIKAAKPFWLTTIIANPDEVG
jgi:prepilin-type N-terminal cleavage/methylation domain-containing protein